jgi:hypothetical protein
MIDQATLKKIQLNAKNDKDYIALLEKIILRAHVYELSDATAETASRAVKIHESDCDVHIDVEHYRINLQNYSGDFELTIVDKLIDAQVENEEIHNIPLPCKTRSD